MWKHKEYKKGSFQEVLAWLVWNKEKSIFAKQTLAIILSNMGSEECIRKFEEMQEEMFPSMMAAKKARALAAERQLKEFTKEPIVINAS